MNNRPQMYTSLSCDALLKRVFEEDREETKALINMGSNMMLCINDMNCRNLFKKYSWDKRYTLKFLALSNHSAIVSVYGLEWYVYFGKNDKLEIERR